MNHAFLGLTHYLGKLGEITILKDSAQQTGVKLMSVQFSEMVLLSGGETKRRIPAKIFGPGLPAEDQGSRGHFKTLRAPSTENNQKNGFTLHLVTAFTPVLSCVPVR